MLENVIAALLWLPKLFVGILCEVAYLISPVRLARKLFFGVPLSEEPDGFFAGLILYFFDTVSLLIAGFGVLLLLKALFS